MMVTPNEIAGSVASVVFVDEGAAIAPVASPPVDSAPVAVTPVASARRPPKSHIASGVPVVAFTGPNGAGKTLLAVECAIRDMAHGKTVYSTVAISSPWGDSIQLTSLRQLLEIPPESVVLLDDVAVIFSSTIATAALPSEVIILLDTMRHRGLSVYWTAPTWMRANNYLRGATQGLVNVYPLLKKSNGDSPWRTPRVVMAGLMDTSTGKIDAPPTRVLRRRMYIPSKLGAWGSYDTLADTPHVGVRRVSRTCADCGGALPILKHSPELHASLGVPWYDD